MPLATIPFGPQHPVLPEPIHLKLTVEDEVIREAVPALGYVHRGLEKLAEVRDFHQMIQIVERVCGICSMMHAMCYCQCIEQVMGVEVPPPGPLPESHLGGTAPHPQPFALARAVRRRLRF